MLGLAFADDVMGAWNEVLDLPDDVRVNLERFLAGLG